MQSIGLATIFFSEYASLMDTAFTPAEAFRESAKIVGSQAALARVCGKQQPAISKRLRAGKPAEPDEVLAIEAATGISRHDLRPDIYPVEDPAFTPAARLDHSTLKAAR